MPCKLARLKLQFTSLSASNTEVYQSQNFKRQYTCSLLIPHPITMALSISIQICDQNSSKSKSCFHLSLNNLFSLKYFFATGFRKFLTKQPIKRKSLRPLQSLLLISKLTFSLLWKFHLERHTCASIHFRNTY